MIERAHDMVRTSHASDWDLTRRVNDLLERERIHELEIVAQRRELDLRFAFEATLEARLLECRQQIEALHARVEVEVQHRFAAELASEREHVAEARRERDEIRGVLDAERRRISYRTVQPIALQMRKGRVVFVSLRRVARVIRDRSAPAR